MSEQFETILSSPEGRIVGIASPGNDDGSAWRFESIDGNIQLIIAKNDDGEWERVGGSEPYFSSWTEELAEKIRKHQH